MNRAMTWMASGLLTISTFLGSLAQEPGPQTTPAERPNAKGPDPQARAKAGEPAKEKEAAKAKGKATAKEAADEKPVVTHHHIRLGGKELKYTATAGLMPIKDSQG